jgi:polysaccharide export outer membrane protein
MANPSDRLSPERRRMMRWRFYTLLSVLVTLLLHPAPAPAQATNTKSDGPKVGNAASVVVDADYKIGAQDVVRIDVWKEPDISRTIPVRPDGKISLPLLNDVQASGLTAMQLAGSIRDGLTKFLTNPQVTVTVTEINSRRVYVTGEVMRTGAIPLLPNMTVLQALASAGGFTQFAKLKDIYILRMENGQQVKYAFDYKEALKGKRPERNILLRPGDLIVVP